MDASQDAPTHTPVLYHEVLSAIQPSAGSRYIDGTLGGAGHARGILLKSGPTGMLLGLDQDIEAIDKARKTLAEFGDRAVLRQGSFRTLVPQLADLDWGKVQGVLFDLGLSSLQLGDPSRGFSFLTEGPLDMRFDQSQELTAEQIIHTWSERELSQLLRDYGEERYARRIAHAITAGRPLRSTTELAEIVVNAVPHSRSRIHPATRTFQALRIAVNDELNALSEGLKVAVEVLDTGGRVAIISFHSLEDRTVKRFFKQESTDCICPPEQLECNCNHQAVLKLITRKPIMPTDEEVRLNPRSRSARLRIAEKV
jgi:16S rRNA (cytosine1402-N4)-methyltransferase